MNPRLNLRKELLIVFSLLFSPFYLQFMKILFAPYNIASMPAITAKALNQLGHDAVCIDFAKHPYKESNQFVIDIDCDQSSKNVLKIVYYKLKFLFVLIKLLLWCDVVHWTWRSILPFGFDLYLVKWFGKPRFIEWVGSDIRIPEVTKIESPWYWEAYNNGYEYKHIESFRQSKSTQNIFSKLGFVPILTPEMQLFVLPDLFPVIHPIFYRCFEKEKYLISENKPSGSTKIRILHSPSAKFAKGSNYILPVIDELSKLYQIEFVIQNKVPRYEVLMAMQNCDIYIDQIVLGSYASAAIEAMAFSKPVIAYIMPRVFEKGIPIDCPIINANPYCLKDKLIELIEKKELRERIGNEGRIYVEKYHDALIESQKLLNIYNNSLS